MTDGRWFFHEPGYFIGGFGTSADGTQASIRDNSINWILEYDSLLRMAVALT